MNFAKFLRTSFFTEHFRKTAFDIGKHLNCCTQNQAQGYDKPLQLFVEKRQFFNQNKQ